MKLEFHHINFVSEDVDRLHDFYTQMLGLDDVPMRQVRVAMMGKLGLPRMAKCRCTWPPRTLL